MFFITDKEADFFQCSWGNIPITLRCDGTNNCGDNSDEESCEKGNINETSFIIIKISFNINKVTNTKEILLQGGKFFILLGTTI